VDISSNIVLRANNIDLASNLLNITELRHISDKIEVPASKKLKRGSLLICTASGSKSHLGKVALIDGDYDYAFGGFMGQLTPKPTLNSKYLFYFMVSDAYKDHIEALSDGVNINNLRFDDLKPLEIPLPPLPEQQRIVTILDDVFTRLAAATANAEKNLKNARELFESYLSSVFVPERDGWVTSELGKEVRFIDYRGKTPPKTETGIRLITAKNVKMNRIQREPEEFIDPKIYDSWMTRGYPRKGDVLFTTEAPLGNVAQLDTDETVVIGQRLITMQPYERVLDRTFLKYALMSRPTQAEILKRGTGATVVGIKASLLKQVPISFPPKVSEQRAMAKDIESNASSVAQLEENYRRKMKELTFLKQSILEKAFSGELTSPPSQVLREAAE
jgi:type I restriction enzyme S subunit